MNSLFVTDVYLPMTTKLAAFLKLDFSNSARTSKFLLLGLGPPSIATASTSAARLIVALSFVAGSAAFLVAFTPELNQSCAILLQLSEPNLWRSSALLLRHHLD